MPSCPVFREPVLRRRGASLPELPSLSNLRSSGVGPATAASVHLKLAAAVPISFVNVVVRSPSGIASDPQGGPHGPLSPLAGEDAAPEAALAVLSLTKFDVSHLNANNSVQHVPPHRIWEEPSLSRGLGLVLAGSADAHVARSRNAGGSRHRRGLGRLQARKRRTGARESCLEQALPAQALRERGARNDDARQAAPAVDAAAPPIQKRR